MTKRKKLLSLALVLVLLGGVSVSRLDAREEEPGLGDERPEPGLHQQGAREGGWGRPDRRGARGRHHGPFQPMVPGAHGPGGLRAALHDLDLSDSQRSEIRSIFEQDRDAAQAHREEMRALGSDLEEQIETDPLDEEAVRERAAAVASLGVEMAVLRARQVGRIREILTPEQRERLERRKLERKAFREERRERFEQRRGPGSGA